MDFPRYNVSNCGRRAFCFAGPHVWNSLLEHIRQSASIAAFKRSHTHPFNGSLSGTTQVSRYQKGKTNLDFTGARDSGWQWHQLGYMQVCTSLQTDNSTSTPPLLCFLQAGCPSCRPTNSVKALKAQALTKDISTPADIAPIAH